MNDFWGNSADIIILLIESILMPIKEAILTYIIFDTVLDNNKEKKKFNVIVEREDNKSREEYLIEIEKSKKSNQPSNA